MNNEFDAIIVGSGIGALTCASLLAQIEHKKVLVLERHFTAGGYTHMFKRKGIYEWDVGVHYVGEMYPGSRYRKLFDFVTGGGVDWSAMPDVYDRFLYPDLTFDARRGFPVLKRDLIAKFPGHRAEIEGYFRDVVHAAKWFGRLMIAKLLPRYLEPLAKRIIRKHRELALLSTREYLDAHISNPRLKGILASQWGDYGLPPHLSAFGLHAVMVCHMQYGGYYPVGGAKNIARSIIPIIESYGGRVLVRHPVSRIVTDGSKAVGVEVITRKRGQDVRTLYFADLIISDAGYATTFNKLVPERVAGEVPKELAHFPDAMSQVCVYLGFKQSPEVLGFKGENHWIFNDYDHDKMYLSRNRVLEGQPDTCFVSFPSLKDPHARAHTAELITFLDYDPFQDWSHLPWQKRGKEYSQVKHAIARGLINLVESRYPGFRDLIDYHEVSTPLSIHGFTDHKKGSVYGLPGIPERFASTLLTPRTPVRNLYMTGADVAGPGIVGGLMSGFMTGLVVSKSKAKLLSVLLRANRTATVPGVQDLNAMV